MHPPGMYDGYDSSAHSEIKQTERRIECLERQVMVLSDVVTDLLYVLRTVTEDTMAYVTDVCRSGMDELNRESR